MPSQDPRLTDWRDVRRLINGTGRQRSAAEALLAAGIMEFLSPYDPVLCGTIPIDCDIPTSDLDIVGNHPDPAAVAGKLRHTLQQFNSVDIQVKMLGDDLSAVCRTWLGDWPVEVVIQNREVRLQRAYGHMLAEALLIHRHGEEVKNRVRALKLRGRTTEEAFGELFYPGEEPYKALMKLYLAEFP